MACGAQPSSKVAWLLGKAGILPPQPVPVPVAPRRTLTTLAHARQLLPVCGAVGEFRRGDLVAPAAPASDDLDE